MLVTTMRHLALLLAFDSIICVDGKAWSKKNNFADDGAEDLDSGALKDFKVAQNGGPEPDGCAEEDMVRVFKDTGNRVVFHYTTSIASFSKAGKKGQKVSSSVGGQPVWVTVGDTESPIMAGIHLALAGRCKGAQLTAVIPSHLGFGDEVRTVGNVEVPGGATLFAELEILEVHQPLPYTVISGNPLLEAGLSVTVTEGRTKCDRANTVTRGDTVSLHYNGSIAKDSKTGKRGKRFDSSYKRGEPMKFLVGTGQVPMKGLDEGLLGLCVGSKAVLSIPPEIGFGAEGGKLHVESKVVPGGATMLFKVEVVENKEEPNVFAELDINGDHKIGKDEVATQFATRGEKVPPEFWQQNDKDQSGYIEWAEFPGPKGENPVKQATGGKHDEL